MQSNSKSDRLVAILHEVRSSHRVLVLTCVALIALSSANPEHRPIDYALAELKSLAAIRPEHFLERLSLGSKSDLKIKFHKRKAPTNTNDVLFPFHEFRADDKHQFPVVVFWERPVSVEEMSSLLHGHPHSLIIVYPYLGSSQYQQLLNSSGPPAFWRLEGVQIDCLQGSESNPRSKVLLSDGSVVLFGPLPHDPTVAVTRICPTVTLAFRSRPDDPHLEMLSISTAYFSFKAAYPTRFGYPEDWLKKTGLVVSSSTHGADQAILPHSTPFFWEVRDLGVNDAIRLLEAKSQSGIGEVNLVGIVIARSALFAVAPWLLAATMLYALVYILELYREPVESSEVATFPWIGLAHNKLAGVTSIVTYSALPSLAAYFLVRRLASPWHLPQGIANGLLLLLAVGASIRMSTLVLEVRRRLIRRPTGERDWKAGWW